MEQSSELVAAFISNSPVKQLRETEIGQNSEAWQNQIQVNQLDTNLSLKILQMQLNQHQVETHAFQNVHMREMLALRQQLQSLKSLKFHEKSDFEPVQVLSMYDQEYMQQKGSQILSDQKQSKIFFENSIKSVESDMLKRCKTHYKEIEKLVKALESRYDDEFKIIHQQLTRKANQEDLAQYRREQQFKASKDELEILKIDLTSALQKAQTSESLKQPQSTQIEQRLTELKNQLSERFQTDLSSLEQQFLAKHQKFQGHLAEIEQQFCSQIHQLTQKSEINEIQKQIDKISLDRKADVKLLTELVNLSSSKTDQSVKSMHLNIINQMRTLKDYVKRKFEDRVSQQDLYIALKTSSEAFRLTALQIGEINADRVSELETKLEFKADRNCIEKIQIKYENIIAKLVAPQDLLLQEVNLLQQQLHKYEHDLCRVKNQFKII